MCLLLSSAGSYAQDADAKQLLAKARELAQAKDFVGAIAHMKKACSRVEPLQRYSTWR